MLTKREQRIRRKKRVRAKISGTAQRPRVSVFRSNAHMFVQLIDDETGKTLVSASDLKMTKDGTKIEMAKKIGEEMASKASALNIKEVVFDRGGFAYKGRVKSFADSLRAAGMQF